MESANESILTKILNEVLYENNREIIEKVVCKINIEAQQGIGFFCIIPFPDEIKMLNVLITNNHTLNNKLLYEKDKKIELAIIEKNHKTIYINLDNRMKYTNEEYDITIIEIKEEDNIKNYLELDDKLISGIAYDNNKNKEYLNKTIYIIQFLEGKFSISNGTIEKIYEDKEYNFNLNHNIRDVSSGSLILNLNNKIIGMHNERYNKATFLNYPIKEFIILNVKSNKLLLRIFNEKYNIYIPDEKMDVLHLNYFDLGNEGLLDLSKIEFKELIKLCLNDNKISDINALGNANFENLRILYLNNNNISDINILEKVNFEYLEILRLNNNNISDINIFEKVNFKELRELNLNQNKISDIKVLEKVNFKYLEILRLNNNNISDINVLEKVNFKKLKELSLYKNQITDINILEKVDFKDLEILDLGSKISDISILENVRFPELKKLCLYENKISDIKVLEKVNFENLEILIFTSNKISDINILEKVNFKKLKKLQLSSNQIKDIEVFEKVNFRKLIQIELINNIISNINVLEKVNFKDLEEINFTKNNISDIKVLEKTNFGKLKYLLLEKNKIDKEKNASIISNFQSKIKYFRI